MRDYNGIFRQIQKSVSIFVSLILLPAILTFSLSCGVRDKSGRLDREKSLLRVTRVIDGDTFQVDDGTGKRMTVRLIGIDAPETRRTRLKDVGYYGEEAKAYLTRLIVDKNVRLEFDVDSFDHYRRALAYVFLENGTFLNAKLVKEGYATVMTVPPNVRYADEFVKLARKARKKKRGLWATES